jgi:hypothetical protein
MVAVSGSIVEKQCLRGYHPALTWVNQKRSKASRTKLERARSSEDSAGSALSPPGGRGFAPVVRAHAHAKIGGTMT